ncbi:hypothetical protein [Cellulomonas sp. PS-H5]|uniref:hypothetical protein n=1 Tax=Cellulomonas sp. PS-H5 TaxID=2820400 RepID=UPI002103490E|nr:hypothetical protein [Cellulomonas sp. PS-H5]
MAADDDRPARARPRDLVEVVHDAPAEDPDRRPGARRPARRWVPLVALAVPVVAVAAVLGAQAAGGGTYDPDVAGARVSERAHGIMTAESGFGAVGGTGGPGMAMTGSSSEAPERGAHDFTVVCASERGRGAHLTVRVGGEVVGEADVACSNGADPDADPLVTVLPLEELGAGWSYEVESETQAAVAVAVVLS